MEDAADGPQNVEYVSEQLEVKGAALEAFSDVFARFQAPPESSTVRETSGHTTFHFLIYYIGNS